MIIVVNLLSYWYVCAYIHIVIQVVLLFFSNGPNLLKLHTRSSSKLRVTRRFEHVLYMDHFDTFR